MVPLYEYQTAVLSSFKTHSCSHVNFVRMCDMNAAEMFKYYLRDFSIFAVQYISRNRSFIWKFLVKVAPELEIGTSVGQSQI